MEKWEVTTTKEELLKNAFSETMNDLMEELNSRLIAQMIIDDLKRKGIL